MILSTILSSELVIFAFAIFILRRPPRLKSYSRSSSRSKKFSINDHTLKRQKKKTSLYRFIDVGMLLTEVSTRLRSGAMLESAWAKTLTHYGLFSESPAEKNIFLTNTRNSRLSFSSRTDINIDTSKFLSASNISDNNTSDSNAKNLSVKNEFATKRVLAEDGVPLILRKIWRTNRFKRMWLGIPNHVVEALPAAFAVCRLGYCAGAPMAEVLDACARGVTEASEARAARKTALAGPIASARMLAALPVIGILFGFVLQVNVLDFLLHTFVGNICLILGLTFELAGILYVRLLVMQAMRDEH